MKKIISFMVGFLLCLAVSAQQKSSYEITGTVIDAATSEAVMGASVFLKDKVGGEITDINGKFKIKAQQGDVLVVTYLGYKQYEYPIVKEEKNLVIKMVEMKQTLDEVVVVGVGAKRKVSQVAALSTVDISELQVPTTSVANLLGGRVAGIVSRINSGEPGKNIAEFWVRGIGTFGYNTGALVLIDGLEGDINTIDPADIESFSILKDASATAVYGVRGANGVVIITTKKGQEGKMTITGRANMSISHLKRLPQYVGAYDYALLANEAKQVRGDSRLYSDIELDIIQKGLDPDLYPNVNWQDVILNKNSLRQNYYVNARGGGEVARYFISLGGSDESAAYNVDKASPYSSNVGYNTYNFRLNLDLSLSPTTKVYFGSDGNLEILKRPGVLNTDNIWRAQSRIVPLRFPVKYSTGDLPSAGSNEDMSPYVQINYTGRHHEQTFKGLGTLALDQDLKFITPGLKFKIQASYDIWSMTNEDRTVQPSLKRALGRSSSGELVLTEVVQPSPTSYGLSRDQFRKYYMKTTLNYDRRFHNDHYISALINAEMEDRQDTRDAFNDNLGLNPNLRSIPKRYLGAAGWLTYSYKDTYLLDINMGLTGTENFQPGRQFGWFPAVGIGWVPTSYEWMRKKAEWLDLFKVRFTIGSVGNDRITSRRFPYLSMVTAGLGSPWDGGAANIVTEAITGADNLEWEQSIKTDLGLDMEMLRKKLMFHVDIYKDQRNGIFQERVQIPQYVGLVNNPFGNVGKMKTFGSDGNISYMHDLNENMSITIRGNYTYWNSIVQNWEQIYPMYPYQEISGYPDGIYRGFKAIGFFKDQNDITYSPSQPWTAVMPGDIKYMDVNGDGVINDDDKVPLSYNPIPRLMYGFGGEFRYKNLTAGFLFKGTGRTDYFITDPDGNTGDGGMGYLPFRAGEVGNILSIVKDPGSRWIPRDYAIAHGIDPALAENPNAQFPRLYYGDNTNNRQVSDFWLRDSRYLRLQEVTLSYNLRSKFLKKCNITSLDIQLIGSNLFVVSPVKLFDPEQARYNGRAYPIPATYTLQIYVNL